MAEKILGVDFAIHGGGSDLIFPHHENEVAQTEAARGKPLARIWMHNGMVRTDDEKMSKSVGNIFQLSEALDRYGREAVVAYLTSGHYRQPLEFSERALEEAGARLDRIRNYIAEVPADESGEEDPFVAERREEFLAALADDFNTPRAWAALFDLVAEGNRRSLPGARPALSEMLELLGLESLLEATDDAPDSAAEALLAERERARAAKDFEHADRIREQLGELGWEVRDTHTGATLRRRGS
jgi:cysteinyl-tRNA synthetase